MESADEKRVKELEDQLRESLSIINDLGKQVLAGDCHRLALDAVIAAIVRSHPAPEVFATALRSTWLEYDEPHTNPAYGDIGMEAAHAVLSLAEDNCPVPIGIRAGKPLPGDQLGQILQAPSRKPRKD